jgi:hypothetical protein
VGASEGQKQALESTYKLLEDEFNWNGKYDPATDEIVLRSGEGKLTNTLFLHESLHAAASHLIDNADKLTGVQRQGYDRLVELYEYSKKALAAEEFNNEFYDLNEFVSYGLTDPVFQAHLRTLGYKAAPYSMWNIFTEAIRKLFNVKTGYESNVMVETMLAADTLLSGSMMLEGLNVAGAKPAKAKKVSAKIEGNDDIEEVDEKPEVTYIPQPNEQPSLGSLGASQPSSKSTGHKVTDAAIRKALAAWSEECMLSASDDDLDTGVEKIRELLFPI